MAANGVEDKKTQEVKNKVDTGAVDEIACFLTKECPREFNAFYRVHNRLQSHTPHSVPLVHLKYYLFR